MFQRFLLTKCFFFHQGAVQVLYLIQEILPAVVNLTKQLVPLTLSNSTNIDSSMSELNVPTTSQHYAVIESDHPYKPASVSNYKVKQNITSLHLENSLL